MTVMAHLCEASKNYLMELNPGEHQRSNASGQAAHRKPLPSELKLGLDS